jgi:hypothetical protein
VDVEDPYITEAAAIYWVVELAKSEAFHKVIIESDAKI